MYLYFKNGTLSMRSEGRIKCDLSIFKEVQINPTEDEKDKMVKNYHCKLKDDKLEFEKPSWVTKEEIETEKKALKDKATNGKITLDDVSNFIKNYL